MKKKKGVWKKRKVFFFSSVWREKRWVTRQLETGGCSAMMNINWSSVVLLVCFASRTKSNVLIYGVCHCIIFASNQTHRLLQYFSWSLILSLSLSLGTFSFSSSCREFRLISLEPRFFRLIVNIYKYWPSLTQGHIHGTSKEDRIRSNDNFLEDFLAKSCLK